MLPFTVARTTVANRASRRRVCCGCSGMQRAIARSKQVVSWKLPVRMRSTGTDASCVMEDASIASGRITISSTTVSDAAAAMLRRPWLPCTKRRCMGRNTMAMNTVQHTAPKKGHRMSANSAVATNTRNSSDFDSSSGLRSGLG